LNRFGNWFKKGMDDFANEQLGVGPVTQPQWLLEGRSKGGRHGRQAARGDRSVFGKPVQPVASEELAPPIKVDISAIPKFRVPAS
jgi:hypothetical protein